MGRVIELGRRGKQHPEPLARVFVPCPACGQAIELAREPDGPRAIACPTCGSRFER